MKSPSLPLVLSALFAPALDLPVSASSAPVGEVLEIHSCQLYTGGCTASSEFPQQGRVLVRVWHFESGAFSGVDLAGSRVALLQLAGANLAGVRDAASRAVAYVPEGTSPETESALVRWVAAQETGDMSLVAVRHAPIELAGTGETSSGRIGDAVHFVAASLESCETGACGQQLWYEPRSRASAFAVAGARSARVDEPLLDLKWRDHGTPSVFVARFGEPPLVARARLAASEICGVLP